MPVERPPGSNTANLVLGTVSTPTARYPEGMRRVVLIGDPTRALGAIAEPECRRVLAALELARELSAPVEWFAVSAGAKIAMDSGTENMDWISRVLRGLIEFTQEGGEINVVVTGINVGAQPYWNAESTMLMHTKGILVMTPDSAMVLTGKQSLDYSGGVSAEDNFGIGGYDRIMGPNGQAQYWAPDLSGAVDVLLAHYAHTYRAPGERFPRPAPTTDPVDRDVRDAPHAGGEFTRVGEIFDRATNPERKKPFDIRSVLRAVADADHPPLERWVDMLDAENVVVYDAHLGGHPVALLGIESRPLPRRGPDADGRSDDVHGGHAVPPVVEEDRAGDQRREREPAAGGAGEPVRLRRLARVAASAAAGVRRGDRPGGGQLRRADRVLRGQPLSRRGVRRVLRHAERVDGGRRGRGLVRLGDRRRAGRGGRVRRRGEQADGGRPARDGPARPGSRRPPRAGAEGEAARLAAELAAIRPGVRSDKLGEVAAEFDAAHSVERAHRMGSVHRIVPSADLRPYLVDAVRRGMARFTG